MKKKIVTTLIFIILCFFTYFAAKNVRLHIYKSKVLDNAEKAIGNHFNFSANLHKIGDNNESNLDSKKFKLVYEINLDCGQCASDLKIIYNLYLELLHSFNEIDLILVINEKSKNYIEFKLDQILGASDLYIIQQKLENKQMLYLLDSENKILMAGDVAKHQFLKTNYLEVYKKDRF